MFTGEPAAIFYVAFWKMAKNVEPKTAPNDLHTTALGPGPWGARRSRASR